MKYLFFDQEFGSSKGGVSRICEFGYVVMDEKRNVTERGNLIMNPALGKGEWDWYALKNILTRTKKEYESQPRFPRFYDKIKGLITSADMVIGHTLDGDVSAIYDECKRYDFNGLDFDFLDVREVYKRFTGIEKNVGVSAIMAEMNLQGDENEHDAEADAFNTMTIFNAISDALELTPAETVQRYSEVVDRAEDFGIRSVRELRRKRIEEMTEWLNGEGEAVSIGKKKCFRLFSIFTEQLQRSETNGGKLDGKKFAFSEAYIPGNIRRALRVVQLIVRLGGSITTMVSEADVFVKHIVYNEDGTAKNDARLNCAVSRAVGGEKIAVVEEEELLCMLGVTAQKLDFSSLESMEFLQEFIG